MQTLTTNPKVNLNGLFATLREEVKRIGTELARTLSLDEETADECFTSCVNSATKQTVQEGRMEAGTHNRESIQKGLDASQKRKEGLESNYSYLKDRKAKHHTNAEEPSFPWIYTGIYGVLVLAMFTAAALTAEMLFAEYEHGRILAWITSCVFIGGSCLANNIYWGEREEERPRFFKRLNWLGLLFFIGLALSFAVGRAVALLELQQTANIGGTGFSLNTEPEKDPLEVWQCGDAQGIEFGYPACGD